MEQQNACKVHPQREASLFCEAHAVWICEYCLKDHKKCGCPVHFTDLYDQYLPQLMEGQEMIGESLERAVAIKQKVQNSRKLTNDTLDELDQILSLHIEKCSNINSFLPKDKNPTISQVKYMMMFLNSDITVEKIFQTLESNLKTLQQEFHYLSIQNNKSSIIQQSDFLKLQEWLPFKKSTIKFNLLFRASKDGFQSSKFHQLCDNIPHTLVIVKTQYDKIIGGYTPLEWKLSEQNQYLYSQDNNSKTFLFSLNLNKIFKLKNQAYAICNSSIGPKFGGGHDLEIVNNCQTQQNQYHNFGHSFDVNGESKESFYGADKFTIKDYEVFQISGEQN